MMTIMFIFATWLNLEGHNIILAMAGALLTTSVHDGGRQHRSRDLGNALEASQRLSFSAAVTSI